MIYCFDLDAFGSLDFLEKEINVSRKMKNGIYYNRSKKIFTDFNDNIVDINDKKIMPVTGDYQIKELNNMITSNGGIPANTNKDLDLIRKWPKYYDTKRDMKYIKGKYLLSNENIKKIEEKYGNEIFFKTAAKNFSNVISLDILKNNKTVFYKTLEKHKNDNFIISEKVNINYDSIGEEEYRCIVVDNEIFNISRRTHNVYHKIDSNVLKFSREVIQSVKNKFPNSYVLDLFRYNKDNKSILDVLEFNPIECAGIYLYNSVLKKSDDLLHNEIENIADEYKEEIEFCKYDGKVYGGSTNNYDHINSFAGDLASLRVANEFGVYLNDIILDDDDFAFVWEAAETDNLLIVNDEKDLEYNGNKTKSKKLNKS